MNKILPAYDIIVMMIDKVFQNKAHSEGTNWRILRPRSIIDQICIRANRIRAINEGTEQQVNDMATEYIRLVNYSAIGCIQLSKPPVTVPDIKAEESILLYEKVLKQAQDDMLRRTSGNEDVMSTTKLDTLNDLILQNITSMKSHFNAQGDLLGGNLKQKFLDVINYGIFALMILDKEKV